MNPSPIVASSPSREKATASGTGFPSLITYTVPVTHCTILGIPKLLTNASFKTLNFGVNIKFLSANTSELFISKVNETYPQFSKLLGVLPMLCLIIVITVPSSERAFSLSNESNSSISASYSSIRLNLIFTFPYLLLILEKSKLFLYG